jgi:molecular chaperone HtpG
MHATLTDTPPETPPTVFTAPVAENFLVELTGVLAILSESIYTAGSEVFIRELMQNGQDAITARSISEPGYCGVTGIEVTAGADGDVTVMVEDNGIGLTLEESRRALATIAFSTKKTSDCSSDDSPFVGRFGIGILSGFLVADEITILSRRAGANAKAVQWVGRIDGTFTATPSDAAMEPGTRVFLRLRADAARQFDAATILETARKYGRYLPHPVTFRRAESTAVVNDEMPLWEQALQPGELTDQGREIFDERFLTAFHFESAEAGARGIAFVKAASCHASSAAAHVVFIKRMLVSERALDIEPAGAPFLSILLNADRLRPIAGRDAVMANDPRLPALRRDIETAMKAHFHALNREEPALLATIVTMQYRCFAKLAAMDREYLGFLLEHLPMETTLGTLTLGGLFRRHASKVEYVTDGTEFQRLQAKARDEGDCIVRVETEASHRLIELVSEVSDGTKAKRITSSEYLGRFASLSAPNSGREAAVLEAVAAELSKENCAGSFCDTDDQDALARLEMGTDESLMRLLSSQASEASNGKRLLLNRSHPVIAQMIGGAADAGLLRAWVRVVYQFALLAAHEVPTSGESRRFSCAMGNVFTASTLGAV